MHLVLCLVTFLASVSFVEVDGQCPATAFARAQSSPSIGRLVTNRNQNINRARIQQVLGNAGGSGGTGGPGGPAPPRPPPVPRGRRPPPPRRTSFPRAGGFFRRPSRFRNKRQSGQVDLAELERLKQELARRQTAGRTSFANGAIPMELIGSCCNRIETFITGFITFNGAECLLLLPFAVPTTQCDGSACFNGFWFEPVGPHHVLGTCTQTAPKSTDVIALCFTVTPPSIFLDLVTVPQYGHCQCC